MMKNFPRKFGLPFLLITAVFGSLATTGCGSSDNDGKQQIVTAFYPLQFISTSIAGKHADVSNLTKPGAEPHDLELTPHQVGDIVDADLVVYLKSFQPSVDKAVAEHNKDKSFDAASVQKLKSGFVPLEEEEHGELAQDSEQLDPHVWLDPHRLAAIADALAHRLEKQDPDHKADYHKSAKNLHSDLDQLDKEYSQGLTNCQSQTIVVSHNAFGYLADRYGLTQVGISGLDPENEPTPQRLAEVTDLARQQKVKTIFFESLVSPKVAKTIADQVGAQTKVLDPIEGIAEDSKATYFTVMRDNLKQLREALQCT